MGETQDLLDTRFVQLIQDVGSLQSSLSFKGDNVAVNVRASLQRALKQLQSERSRIERQISALTDALSAVGGATRRAAARVAKRARPRRKMSAAAKKAISVRMRKYWAERRKGEIANFKCQISNVKSSLQRYEVTNI